MLGAGPERGGGERRLRVSMSVNVRSNMGIIISRLGGQREVVGYVNRTRLRRAKEETGIDQRKGETD